MRWVAFFMMISTAIAIGHGQGPSFESIAKSASQAVVFIQVQKSQETPYYFNDPVLNELFFGRPPGQSAPLAGQGSGFFIDADGHILTNSHVVAGANRIVVRLSTNERYEARLVGTDPQSDIALIKVDGDAPFSYLNIDDSDTLSIGEWVLAIGNPFGLSNTLTAGIVSAKGRNDIGVTSYENFIQTDAAINPGNSGGPLVNMNGDVVGINTAIFSQSGGSMGIGFAIPMSMANAIKHQLMQYGQVIRGYLGVVIVDEAEGRESRVRVVSVAPNGPADDAGIQDGDIILTVANDPVTSVSGLRNTVALTPPGTRIELTVKRNNQIKRIRATIGRLD